MGGNTPRKDSRLSGETLRPTHGGPPRSNMIRHPCLTRHINLDRPIMHTSGKTPAGANLSAASCKTAWRASVHVPMKFRVMENSEKAGHGHNDCNKRGERSQTEGYRQRPKSIPARVQIGHGNSSTHRKQFLDSCAHRMCPSRKSAPRTPMRKSRCRDRPSLLRRSLR